MACCQERVLAVACTVRTVRFERVCDALFAALFYAGQILAALCAAELNAQGRRSLCAVLLAAVLVPQCVLALPLLRGADPLKTRLLRAMPSVLQLRVGQLYWCPKRQDVGVSRWPWWRFSVAVGGCSECTCPNETEPDGGL